MKILFVTNQTKTCGVAEFGRQHVKALRDAGHIVTEWSPGYDYQEWPDLRGYNVVHVNFHPGTLGHLRPPEFTPRILSAYLHEPGSQWGFGEIRVAFAAEPILVEGGWAIDKVVVAVRVPMPVVDYESSAYVLTHSGGWRAGTSSLRQAGVDWVAPVLEKMKIEYDHGQHKGEHGGWISTEEEIDRLNECDFLIYWYPGANAGQSAGLTMAIAAQRPIVLNHNRMFASVEGEEHRDELYFADDIETGVEEVLRDLKRGIAKIPRRLKRERGWAQAAARMAGCWERMK